MFQKSTPGLVSGLVKFNTYSNSFYHWSSTIPYFFMMMSFAGKCPLHTHLGTRKWVIIINKSKWWWNNRIPGMPLPQVISSTSCQPQGSPPALGAILVILLEAAWSPLAGASIPIHSLFPGHASGLIVTILRWQKFPSLTQGNDAFFF